MKPIAIDLFCGLGGWADGLLVEGYDVIGYDIEAHDYGEGGYPGTLILQDVTTLHGSQFKDATLIVCSPPCQEYSYMAMPWSKAKAKAAAIRADETGDLRRKLNLLFDTCFRLQREAIEAAGHYIPMIVENVRGAQEWVGQAAWHYGSFYLWGDVPALMPTTKAWKAEGQNWNKWKENGTVSPHWRMQGDKPKSTRLWQDGVKADGSGWTDKGSLQSHNRLVSNQSGQKLPGNNAPRLWSDRRIQRLADGLRHEEDSFYCASSGSKSRKAASAKIAKIPFPLARYMAQVYKPLPAQIQEQLAIFKSRSPSVTIPPIA